MASSRTALGGALQERYNRQTYPALESFAPLSGTVQVPWVI